MERLVRAAPTARGYPADMAKVGSWLLNWVRQPEPIRATRQAGKIQPGTVEGPAAALTVAAGRPAGCAERPSGEMESSTRLGMMSAPPMQAVTTAAMRQPRSVTRAKHRGLNTAPRNAGGGHGQPDDQAVAGFEPVVQHHRHDDHDAAHADACKGAGQIPLPQAVKKVYAAEGQGQDGAQSGHDGLAAVSEKQPEVTPTAAAEARERMV